MLFNTVYNLALILLVELSFDILCSHPLKTNVFNPSAPFAFPPPPVFHLRMRIAV